MTASYSTLFILRSGQSGLGFYTTQRDVAAGAMGTLRTAAMNLLRLAGFQSIRAGLQAVMHDIKALLAMAQRQRQPNP